MAPLIIIPAKAHSERIPDKNYRLLNGMAPALRAIRVAQAMLEPATVVVTADRLAPADWTMMPPWMFSQAHASDRMMDVVLDVLARVAGAVDQPVLLLQPTQPLRRVAHLVHALIALDTHPSVVSVVQTREAQKCYVRSATGWLSSATYMDPMERDQECRVTYTPDGTVYGFRRQWFLDHQAFITSDTYALIVPPEESARLDTLLDWRVAEMRLRAEEGWQSVPAPPDTGASRDRQDDAASGEGAGDRAS